MHNFEFVKGLESADGLHEVGPALLFGDGGAGLLTLFNFVEEVAPVSVLHDDAEGGGGVLEKGFLVADDVLLLDGGEDAHLVEGVLLLFFGKFSHFDLGTQEIVSK